MTHPASDFFTRVKTTLVAHAGGYLRNTVRMPGVTCRVCATPVDSGAYCDPCFGHCRTSGIADQVCSLTYALRGTQSGYLMRQYKAPNPVREHQAVLAALMIVGEAHNDCLEALSGRKITHWSFVPSLPARPGTHPFRMYAQRASRGEEIRLYAAERSSVPRSLSRDHFRSTRGLPPGSHVLLMDDTWAAGGHAQSAALALRAAGAAMVSIMTAARWINPGYGNNRTFVAEHLAQDFHPDLCPWTGRSCPA
ncbi:hypothetical protein GCM10010402_41820 [Actinomadura luteofluorescens]|nr:hypothetical protein [Actinomadura glauciflava]